MLVLAGAVLRQVALALGLLVVLVLALWAQYTSSGDEEDAQSKEAPVRPQRRTASKTRIEPKVTADVRYYAVYHGYDFQEYRTTTKDGFVLPLYRIRAKETASSGAAAKPVILQHGLFMSSGVFVTNERHSLAFVLADAGYDVWLGNNRGVLLENVHHQPSSEAFWDWSVDELARFDVPAIVDRVTAVSGHAKVVWIGHSQGNAQAFMSFCTDAATAGKIAMLVALAPVACLGPLPSWPLKFLQSADPDKRRFWFSNKEFVPIMCIPSQFAPASVFSVLGYSMFLYLFKWSDRNWVKRRKPKYFQFAPRPQSCKLVEHWGTMTKAGRLVTSDGATVYPFEDIMCPVALIHGKEDYMAACDRVKDALLARNPDRLAHVLELDGYEHLDLIWGRDSHMRVFEPIMELLRSIDY